MRTQADIDTGNDTNAKEAELQHDRRAGDSRTNLERFAIICGFLVAISLGYAIGTDHASSHFRGLLRQELTSTFGCDTDTDCDQQGEEQNQRLWILADSTPDRELAVRQGSAND